MKKVLFIISLLCLSVIVYAQEEKPESNKKASADIEALQTAYGLAKYGYANYSASALLEAARIIATTKVQPLDATCEKGTSQAVADKEKKVSFEPAQLVSDAKKYAGDDKVILAFAKKIEDEIASGKTRGAVGGPKHAEEIVHAKDIDIYKIKFYGEELAEVVVIGDGDNDLDLYVYDQNGNLIDSDTDYTDRCVCQWVPSWTGTFTIRIRNRGSVYSNYVLLTN